MIEGDKNDRYFTHLKSVMEIVLRELPGANIERVVMALYSLIRLVEKP